MADLKFQALGDFVFATEVDTADEQVIKVVDSQATKYLKVVAAGEDVKSIKVGDKILPYPAQGYAGFTFEGTQYLALHESEIMGVFNV